MVIAEVFRRLVDTVNYIKERLQREKELSKLELDILMVLGSDLGAYTALDILPELNKVRNSITSVGSLYAALKYLADKRYIRKGDCRLKDKYFLLPKGISITNKYCDLLGSRYAPFYRLRVEALNANKHRFREPERTMLIDVLANGSLSPDADRYLIKDEE